MKRGYPIIEAQLDNQLLSVVTGTDTTNYECYDYKPYGELLSSSSGTEKRIGYMGQERNFENSYFAMGARMYDPETGRFLSADPLLELFPGQSPYHYAYNSPIMWKDPSGLSPEKEKGGKDEVLEYTSEIKIGTMTYYRIKELVYDINSTCGILPCAMNMIWKWSTVSSGVDDGTYLYGPAELNFMQYTSEFFSAGHSTSWAGIKGSGPGGGGVGGGRVPEKQATDDDNSKKAFTPDIRKSTSFSIIQRAINQLPSPEIPYLDFNSNAKSGLSEGEAEIINWTGNILGATETLHKVNKLSLDNKLDVLSKGKKLYKTLPNGQILKLTPKDIQKLANRSKLLNRIAPFLSVAIISFSITEIAIAIYSDDGLLVSKGVLDLGIGILGPRFGIWGIAVSLTWFSGDLMFGKYGWLELLNNPNQYNGINIPLIPQDNLKFNKFGR